MAPGRGRRRSRANLRWCSDVFEITCWNGEIVRIVFVIDAHDREVLAWHAVAGAGVSGSMVRDLMSAYCRVEQAQERAERIRLQIIRALYRRPAPALGERRHHRLARRLVTHRAGYTFFTRITSCSGTAGAYASTEELIVHQPLSTKNARRTYRKSTPGETSCCANSLPRLSGNGTRYDVRDSGGCWP
jgi:hypothetical protein